MPVRSHLVLRGRAQFPIGDELIDLAEGDCVTFDPRKPYRVTAIGKAPAMCWP